MAGLQPGGSEIAPVSHFKMRTRAEICFGVTKSSHSRMRTRASCTRAPCTHAFAAHDGGAHRVATALPAHRHARARFPAPCARAHASTAHSARAQHACARLAGDAHALTRQHTLARQKLDVMLEALATGWPSAGWRLAHLARARCANASPPPLLARPMRHPHALPAFTTAVATVCSEIMMTSEMETNETMQKTENTMQDARECARAARVCGSHSRKRTRERARRSQASEQSKTSFKNMCAPSGTCGWPRGKGSESKSAEGWRRLAKARSHEIA